MVQEVGDLFIALNSQSEFRLAVLGGRGKSFCAGADRKEVLSEPANDLEARYLGQLGRRAARAIEDCELVTIARVHGHAIGGCCFATSCDFRVSTSGALFYVPEVELGVPLPWGATPRLIHEIGALRPADGTDFPTSRWNYSASLGSCSRSCEDEELDSAVDRWTERFYFTCNVCTNV